MNRQMVGIASIVLKKKISNILTYNAYLPAYNIQL
mgnify:CR=1 FL=1